MARGSMRITGDEDFGLDFSLSFFVPLSPCLVECNYITGFPGFCEVTVYAQKRIKAEGARTVWDTAYFSDNA